MATVRPLAAALQVSPATVAAAYRTLRQRGFVVTDRGRGTSVAAQPPVRVKAAIELPEGVRDLASGNRPGSPIWSTGGAPSSPDRVIQPAPWTATILMRAAPWRRRLASR
jgi:DNA-binding transcriptional MocR family regulator